MSHANVVYFAHGKESGPWGTKIVRLAKIARQKGCHVESPDYSSTTDPDKRVKQLLSLKPQADKNLILVGSSMGGYVSTVVSKKLRPRGLFLLAPAFFRRGYTKPKPEPQARHTWIIHGWKDDVIPVESSFRFAKEYKVHLYIVDSDHRLISALPQIEELFTIFLNRILKEKS